MHATTISERPRVLHGRCRASASAVATGSAPTPRSRTPSIWPGSSRMVLKGHGRPGAARQLLRPSGRRSPSRSSTRANKSIEEFGPIFEALGLLDSRRSGEDAAEHGGAQRRHARRPKSSARQLREAIAFKVYEFDAHGVEMNQRYALRRGRRRRQRGAGIRRRIPSCTTSRRRGPARGCRMSGCSTRTAPGSRRSTSAGNGRFTRPDRHWRRRLGRGRQGSGAGARPRHRGTT